MILKSALPEGTAYIPADIKKWSPETIQCDIANDAWPQPPGRVDTVAALGVLEYVEDYQGFFHRLRQYSAEVVMSYQAIPFSHHQQELNSHDPRRHRLPGFPFERMHSLYLHELVEAAAYAGFAVGWIQYRNVNAGIKACASKGPDGFCFKEDEVLLKLLPISIPQGAADYRFQTNVVQRKPNSEAANHDSTQQQQAEQQQEDAPLGGGGPPAEEPLTLFAS
jgi:hypothetical protein